MGGSSKYLPASDGLPARVSGAWAQEKLHYVGRYCSIVTAGMKKKWASCAYVDLLAGPGRCIIPATSVEFDGSPIVALNVTPSFGSLVLVEGHAPLNAALISRTAGYATPAPLIVSGDCNAMSTWHAIRDGVPADALTICFADMLGSDVDWDTVRWLSAERTVDWLITFQVSDLTRNAEQALKSAELGARFDKFFGTPAWRAVVEQQLAANKVGRDVANALAEFYRGRLATIGYGEVVQLHTLMKNTKGAPLYRLIMASRHPRARDFFERVTKVSFAGDRRLPGF